MKFFNNTVFFLLLIFISAQSIFAQAPQKMSYQAVVRDVANNLVINRSVGLRFTIIQGTANGNTVYVETHRSATNRDGLVSVEIGGGVPFFNSIGNINWANGPYFLKTDIDPNGATAYSITGTAQLLSVPYALYAEKSANPGNPGFNTLIVVTPYVYNPLGRNPCLNGGLAFDFGLDTNRNNVLETAEINSSLRKYVCNGKDGKGIVNTVDNGNGTFTLNYTDGTLFTTSNLTGPQGPQGSTGVGISSTIDNGNGSFTINYTNGSSFTTGNLTGPQGVAGAQGATGANGKNTTVKTSAELAGANCSTGGVKLEYGLDANSNGVLDAGEINATLTKYVCNGAVGATGPIGAQGTAGTNGQNTTVKTSAELAGVNCSTGGVKLEYGLDANSNGVLDAGEINAALTKYVCNGAVGATGPIGAQGTAGANGQNTLVKTSAELAGANCSTGGVKLEYGLDVNSNGVLDAGEINATLTKYVCNGAVGATGPIGAQVCSPETE